MLPEIIIWAVVFVIGVPSAWRNPTAAALVISWILGELVFLFTGNNLPTNFYLFPDIAVIAVIYTKSEYRPCDRYRSAWHQLACLVIERSPADRAVLFLFSIEWAFYIAPVGDFYRWWTLWGCVILQILFASAESIETFWRSHSMPSGETVRGGGASADRDRFIIVPIVAQTFAADFNRPSLVSLTPPHTSFAARVVDSFLHIPLVRPAVAIPQICKAIVRRIAVDVVDALGRPRPVENGPCYPVCESIVAANGNADAALFIRCAASLSSAITSVPPCESSIAGEQASRFRQPIQLSGFRLIAEKLTERFRGWYFSDSHCAVPSREGQGRALFPQRFRPAFPSTDHAPTQRRGADADGPAMLVACEGRGYG